MNSVYKRILAYLAPYKPQFVVALLCTVFFGASEGGIPFLIKFILDGIFAGKNEALLLWLPIAIVGFAVFRAVFDFLQNYLLARLGHIIVRDIRNEMNLQVLSMSPSFFVREKAGDLLSKLTSDVVMVKSLLTESLSSLIRDSIRVIALLSVAVYLDPVLAAIGVIAFPLAVYPVMRFGKRVRRLYRKGQDGVGALSSLMQQTIQGSKVVQVFGQEGYETERYNDENQRLTDSFVKSEKARAMTGPVNEVLGAFAIAGVVLYGGYSVIGNYRSQGDFIAFLAALFLLYEPFKKLSKVYNTAQQGLSAAERIFELLDAKRSITDPENPEQPSGRYDILLQGVSYTYPKAESGALREITLEVKEGARVALVGFSGAGKSTLVDLIPRFIDPQQGVVRIGGVDVRNLMISDLRDMIAMVGQHTFLFNDTIFQNIAYGKSGATEAQVIEAAKAAFAHDFIKRLPDGYHTEIGEGGLTLSGGERQRIAIARAILKDAPVLILDEATASLDNQAEREVQAALETLEKERTSLVIAHRLSTVQSADMIVVLEEGKIVEHGKHEELLAQNGLYSKLHQLQFHEPERDDVSSSSVAGALPT